MAKYILILLMIINTLVHAETSAEKVTVLMPSNFFPHVAIKNGEPTGLAVDIFKEIADISGIEYEFIVKPTFATANKAFLNKEADLLLSNGITSKRKENRNFTSAFATSKILAYKLASDEIDSLDKIPTKKLVLKTSNAANKFFKNHPKNQLKYVDSKEEAIVSLISGESDVFVINEAPMKRTLKLTKFDKIIVPFGEPIHKVDLAIAVQKNRPELLKKLDSALKQFMKTERFKNIYDHYIYDVPLKEISTKLTQKEKTYIQNNTFTICERHGIYPVADIKDGKLVGIMGDYVDEIVKHTGLKLKVLDATSIEEFQQNFKENKCDIVGVKGKNTKVLPKLTKTNTTLEFPYTILGDIKSFNMDAYTNLNNFKYIVRYISIKKRILSSYPNLDIDVIRDVDTAMSKVKGNVHLIGTKPIMEKIIQQYGFEKYKINGVLDNVNQQLTMGVHQQHPQLLSIINKAISQFDPIVLNRIYDKYSIKEFKQVQNYFYLWYVLAAVVLLGILLLFVEISWNKKLKISNLMLKQKKQELEQAQKIGQNGNWSYRISDGKIEWSNEMFNIYGRDPNLVEITYDKLISWIHPDDVVLHNNYMEKMLNLSPDKDIGLLIHRLIRPNGDIRWVEVSVEGQYDKNGALTSFFGTLHDITEDKMAQEKINEQTKILTAQSRLAAMGEMISMIAHQWRQPLSVISMDANNILVDIALENFSISEAEKYAHKITEQTQHLSHTIDDFRNFFKPDKELLEINLEEVIDSTLSIVKDSLKNNNIELTTSFETDIKVKVYPRELMQVFVNIINNAKDALTSYKPNNAVISIRVYEDEKYINTEICDNGGGIKDDILPKVFDPYFSTKDEKNGTGLGLYMSKMIVEKHLNGTIAVCNKNEGACFIIKLLKV